MAARGTHPVTFFIDAGGLPADGRTIDALARLVLVARRHGCETKLCQTSAELLDLIEFAGLSEAFGTGPVSPRSSLPRC